MSDVAAPPAFQGDEIHASRPAVAFVLPFALTSLNVRQRQHWAELTRERKRLIQEVMVALGGPRYFPRPPFARARVTVVRSSAGQLDPDNLVASCKPLMDALCVASNWHPGSLGIIEDDSARQCELVVKQHNVPKGDGVTSVLVECLPPLPVEAKPEPKRKPRRAQYHGESPSRIARAHKAGVWTR